MLSSCKEINDLYAKSSLLLITNGKYLSFDVMTPKSHRNLNIIVLVKLIEDKIMVISVPIGLCSTLAEYKNRQFFRVSKLSPKHWDFPPNNCKKLTQWNLVNLDMNIFYTTKSILQTLTTKNWWPFFQNLEVPNKSWKVIDPAVLCASWSDYYLHNWINNPNLIHQTLMALLSKPLYVILKQLKGLNQWVFVPLGPNRIYTT